MSEADQARRLLREARMATLATVCEQRPFASLVTPATTAGGEVLLFLSELSGHTQHLREVPYCSLMAVGAQPGINPQTSPRISVHGKAVLEPDRALLDRFLSVHPYAAPYADFGDFKLWRIEVESALYVGGFAQAARLSGEALLPDSALVARVQAEAAGMLGTEPAWLDRVLKHCGIRHGQLTAIDVDGVDVSDSERCVRVSFSRPIGPGDDLRTFLAQWSH